MYVVPGATLLSEPSDPLGPGGPAGPRGPGGPLEPSLPLEQEQFAGGLIGGGPAAKATDVHTTLRRISNVSTAMHTVT